MGPNGLWFPTAYDLCQSRHLAAAFDTRSRHLVATFDTSVSFATNWSGGLKFCPCQLVFAVICSNDHEQARWGGGVLKFFRFCPICRWAVLRGWPRFAPIQPEVGAPRDSRAWGPLWGTYLATQSIPCI